MTTTHNALKKIENNARLKSQARYLYMLAEAERMSRPVQLTLSSLKGAR